MSDLAVDGSAAAKKTARIACDACSYRKVKCPGGQPCASCVSMDLECKFERPRKKRGPAGKRLTELRRRQGESSDPLPRSDAADGTHLRVETSLSPISGEPGPISPFFAPPSLDSTPSFQLDAVTLGGLDQSLEQTAPNLPVHFPVAFSDADAQSSDYGYSPLPDGTGMTPLSHTTSATDTASNAFQTLPSDTAFWPLHIGDDELLPWIEIFFERLHPTVPLVSYSSLYNRLMSQEHHRNAQFGAMILSLCAFALTQPVQVNERSQAPVRSAKAREMMQDASKMRSSLDFGENPTLDAILASFFLFGSLFGSDSHNAAWLRLREAVDLAETLGLNRSEAYEGLVFEDKMQRLRTYLVLSVTERAYALQRQHSIGFRGRPGLSTRFMYDLVLASAPIGSTAMDSDMTGLLGLVQLMELFDVIDEGIINCWNERCNARTGRCDYLTTARALSIFQALLRSNHTAWTDSYLRYPADPNDRMLSAETLDSKQKSDVLITQQWLLNRISQLCYTHNILQTTSDFPELRFDFTLAVAHRTLEICNSLSLNSMEVHGVGLIEKLYDIITSAMKFLAYMGHPPSPDSIDYLLQQYFDLFVRLRGGNHLFLHKFVAERNALATEGHS